jgi:hypothetical protein
MGPALHLEHFSDSFTWAQKLLRQNTTDDSEWAHSCFLNILPMGSHGPRNYFDQILPMLLNGPSFALEHFADSFTWAQKLLKHNVANKSEWVQSCDWDILPMHSHGPRNYLDRIPPMLLNGPSVTLGHLSAVSHEPEIAHT